MQITEIIIKDFGPIASFHAQPTENIIGITGRNGQGKSHVLSAIRWLFTGKLKNPANTYLRKIEDPDNPGTIKVAKRAFISITFTANGLEGVIEKTITPTTVRHKFKWDGKEYTKAEPIIRLLEDIFQTKRNSMLEVAFRRQKQIEGLLFGSQADREQLFSEMLNVDFTKARDALHIAHKRISESFRDLAPQIKMAEDEVAQAKASLEEVRVELGQIPEDLTKRYTQLKNQLQSSDKLRAALSRQEDLVQQLGGLSVSVDDLTKQQRYDVLCNTIIFDTRKRRDDLIEQKAQVNQKLSVKVQLEGLEKKLTTFRKRASELTAQLGNLTAAKNIADINTGIRQTTNKIRQATELAEVNEKIPPLELVLEDTLQRIDELSDTVNNAEDRSLTLKNMVATLKQTLEVREELSKCKKESKDSVKCPKCGLNWDRDSLAELSDAQMDQFRSELQLIQFKADEAEQELGLNKKNLDQAKQRKLNAEATLQQLRTRQHDLQSAKGWDVPTLELELSELEKSRDDILKQATLRAELETSYHNVSGYIKDLQAEINELPYTGEKTVAELKAELENLNTSIQEVEKAQAALDEERQHLQPVVASILQTQQRIGDAKDQLKQVKIQIEELSGQTTAEITDDLKQELDVLGEKVNRQTVLHAMASDRSILLERALNKAAQLDEEASKDSHKREIALKLEKTRELLSRTGLPGIFMQERFLKISEATQVYLHRMAAEFSVCPADMPLTFDIPEVNGVQVDLPMTKLSGGQQGRLAVAFMMACSSLLIPDVKFLTLDEPSTSSDAASIEEMVNMFSNLEGALQELDWQVWVVDHNETFERAFAEHYKV
jgi:DNA repair exonuclease SbcCD ATPase subunit